MTGDEDDICHAHVDGVQVCSTRCFEKAILLFVAVYYVFKMVICQHAMKAVIFILKFGCNLTLIVKQTMCTYVVNTAHDFPIPSDYGRL